MIRLLRLASSTTEMVEANKGRIDEAYDALRGEINPDQRFAMPRTRQALQAVMLAAIDLGAPLPRGLASDSPACDPRRGRPGASLWACRQRPARFKVRA